MDIIRQIEKNFWVVYLLLIAVLSYQLADIAGAIVGMKAISSMNFQSEKKLTNNREKTPPAVNPAVKFSDIIKNNIFNTSKRAPNIKKNQNSVIVDINNLDSIPLSRSGLELLGTSISEKKNKIALIKNKSDVDIFHLNDQVPGGKINQILRRAVILNNNGKAEKLVLDTAPPKIKSIGTSKNIMNQGINTVTSTSFKMSIKRSTLGLGNMNEFMTQMRLTPSIIDGKTKGFLVSQSKPGSIFSKLGILNGDVIEEINGTKIEIPENAYEVYRKLMSENSISVQLTRAKKRMTMTYQLTD